MTKSFEHDKLSLMPDGTSNTPLAPAKAAHQRFGEGKQYQPLFKQLAERYGNLRHDANFFSELDRELIFSAGRPSSLFHAKRLSEQLNGAQIFIKREDLMPAGSMLTTAITGQALCARRLGRKCLVTASRDGRGDLVLSAKRCAREPI